MSASPGSSISAGSRARCSIPLGELARRVDELPRGRTLVMVCHTGRRSQNAAMFLARSGFDDVQNLEGGVEGWAVEVDPSMKRY